MAFMLALVFIFEIVNREVESVTKPREGIIGARDLEAGVPVGAVRPPTSTTQQGHNVDLPPGVTENGQPLNDVYAEVTGQSATSLHTIISCIYII
jgi:hypothetical protein